MEGGIAVARFVFHILLLCSILSSGQEGSLRDGSMESEGLHSTTVLAS